MLGREIAEPSRVTSFTDEGDGADAARSSSRPRPGPSPRHRGRGRDGPPRRGRRPGRPAGLGPVLDRQGHLRRPAARCRAASRSRASRSRRGSTRAAIAAASRSSPRTARPRASCPTLSVRDNITLGDPALAGAAAACSPARPTSDAIADELIDRLHIKTSGPRPEGLGAVGRQPAEGAPGPHARHRRPRLLILDDPTRGIDVGAKAEIQALVSELAGKRPGGRAHQLRPRGGRRGLGRARRAARRRRRRRARGRAT